MKYKYCFVILFSCILSCKLYGQNVRVNNSFVILINDKLVRSVAGLQLVSSDINGKEDSIDGGYYPGILYVGNTQKKNLFYADSLKKLTLKFSFYEYKRKRQVIHNYRVELDRKWFKETLIIVKICDINKKHGTYKYTFEVPGYSFGSIKI